MKTDETPIEYASRRNFLLGLTTAATLPALPASLFARSPASGAAPGPALPTTDSGEVDAVMAIVSLRFGAYIKSEEMPMVRRAIERQRESILTLRKVSITNGDAPDYLFSPDGR